MDILGKKFGELSGGKVLDIGTGRGWFINLLKENLKDYDEFIGIDIREEVLKEAKEKFGAEDIKFIKVCGTSTNFENDSMDTVSLSNSIHHLSNYKEIFEEVKRVLKPGGYFIVQEMFRDNQSEKQNSHVLLHHFQGDLDRLKGICHNKTYKKQEIIDIIKDYGFNIIDTFEHNTHDEQKEEENLEKEKEILDNVFSAIENHIEEIKGTEEYDYYKNKIEELRGKLYNIGFFTATELIVIAENK